MPMELEVRHLRALCAIDDTGSLHKAARLLGMTQPSLSTQLRRIEETLGGALFARERTGCRATPLGRVVLNRARPLVDGMRALVTETRAAGALAAGGPHLRIGSTASRAIPGWLRRLRQREHPPGGEPALRMDVSANALLRLVGEGQLDVAFVHEVEGSPLRVRRVCAAASWSNANRSTCPWPPTIRPPGAASCASPTSPTTGGWSTPPWTASGTDSCGS